MKPTHSALALVGLVSVLAALAGCGSESPDPHGKEASAQEADVRVGALWGTWRFVYTDARRADVEAKLAAEIQDAEKLWAAKREAEEESAASEIEFTREGWFLSRVEGKEIDRAPYNAVPMATQTLRLSTMRGGEVRSTEVDVMADEITIRDPKKGALVFHRAAR
jgi:hypothetical protein